MAELKMDKPIMPKATAIWLVENTALSFEQIADFTGLHAIEVQALADEEVGRGIVGEDPVKNGEVTAEDIKHCEANPDARLKMLRNELPTIKIRAKGPRYTPVSRRTDKPDAIAFLLKHNPEISDAQICKLVGTTKPTIAAVRDRTHPNSSNLRPRHPAEIGLCTYQEVENASRKGMKAQGKDYDAERAKRLEEQAKTFTGHEELNEEKKNPLAGFDFSNFMKTGN
jgi:hypothetical protein